jgi:hypothetical protein
MSSHSNSSNASTPLDLSKWRSLPTRLMLVGGVLSLIGLLVPSYREQFSFSWLVSFMFFLSLCLGGWFMVLVHHLFDASWSVPIRRVTENLACQVRWMAVLFVPIALFAPRMYPWMELSANHTPDHALHAKGALLNIPTYYLASIFCFAVWWYFTTKLRFWSLEQDRTGSAECTNRMRKLAYFGVFAFAITLTLGVIIWMKSLQHQWFSTMYGVYYFAGSVWLTIATVYVITLVLKRQGPLREVVQETQFYFLGSLLFAFTVFYAYIHFSQYFIIWNANIPEETFWYVLREKGSWWQIGLLIVFGHFFLPFLALLRIDAKMSWIMIPLGVWAWLMHYIDIQFNIMPILHPDGFVLHWLDIGSFAFMAGFMAKNFMKDFAAYPAYPQKDPRFAESMGVYVAPASKAHATKVAGGAR